MSDMYEDDEDGSTAVLDKDETDIQEPQDYHCIILNDDYSQWDLVVGILREVFGKSAQDAEAITQDVHKKGKGIAGTYTYDIAATKAAIANQQARKVQQPLKTIVEAA